MRQWAMCFSSGDSDMKGKPHSGQPCTAAILCNKEHLDQFICANRQITIRELCMEWMSASVMVAMLEYCKVCSRQVPWMLTQEQKEHKFVRTYWTNTGLKVSSLDRIISDKTWYHHHEPESKWQHVDWWREFFIGEKLSGHSPQRVKCCAQSFGIGKGGSFWISWNLGKPSTQTVTSQRWLSWRLELPESGQRRWQPFSCYMITPGPIPVWRPWITLPILAGLSYHTHHVVWMWGLLISICWSWWKMDCVGNIFNAAS